MIRSLIVLATLGSPAFSLVLYLEEGENCGYGGKCRRLSECPTAQADLRAGRTPVICSFDALLPIVCCHPEAAPDLESDWATTSKRPANRPTTGRPSGRTVSQRMCEKYKQYVFREEQVPTLTFDPQIEKIDECGRIEQTLIVGGSEAKSKEFPHMALIGYGSQPRIAWLCGGSLISERFILSAAHCSNPGSKGPAKWAKLGVLDMKNDRGNHEIVAKIVERFDHPSYNNIQLYNDITLFKLENDIQLNPWVRPICLQTNFDFGQPAAIASGWGHTQWGGGPTNRLQKVKLNIVDNDSCNSSYQASIGKQLPNGIVESTMLCAGDEEGKDTCQGDSGGPLQIPLRSPYCMYAIVGVTSFGRACAQNYPGVYTRVSHYRQWIEKIVWPGQ
ncbi:serine protease [Nesidiocoris tenuis]|uniref:Serine protease n=1 Tax=Nesidiocoris tenuis TaxID=355587 RepID=A0ABN7BCJ5_9HEMI|nr:serine protease [Nesidiocoris tenuis]